MGIIIAKDKDLKVLIKRVNEDKAPIFVATEKGDTAVIMSLENYESIEETIYLLSSKANAKWLYSFTFHLKAL